MTPKELLEHLQCEEYRKNGIDPDTIIKKMNQFMLNPERFQCIFNQAYGLGEQESRASYQQYMEECKQHVLKTKYQNPMTYSLLVKVFNRVNRAKDRILPNHGITPHPIPYFGSVFSSEVNAYVDYTGAGEPLIVFHDPLFIFAQLIGKIIASFFPVLDSFSDDESQYLSYLPALIAQIKNSSEIKLRFCDLMLAIMMTGNPGSAKQYLPSSDYTPLVDIMVQSFEAFVGSHEYAHFALGHRGYNKLSDTDEMLINWKMEFDADRLGTELTLDAMKEEGYDKHITMLGIFLCTKSFEIFERLNALKAGKDYQFKLPETHPLSYTRTNALIKAFVKDENINIYSDVAAAIDFLWNQFTIFHKEFSNFLLTINVRMQYIPFNVIQNIMYQMKKETWTDLLNKKAKG